MWQRRLNLGTYFRISVYVHWTFSLLVAYVAYAGYQDGVTGMFYSVLLLLAMFLCVTLHEYGHALTARRFGIETLDITLFPIGGVARLMKIPRVPWQELLVAVAGPAVNVVIILLIATLLIATAGFGLPGFADVLENDQAAQRLEDALNAPSLLGFTVSIALVNLALVLFNMIPAFPMDGGRVLRSLLAMVVEYRLATRVASTIGIACALVMAALALYFGHPTAGLVAAFICYAGLAEAKQVDVIEPLRDLSVSDAMIHHPPRISIDVMLGELVEHLRSCPAPAIPVVAPGEVVTGMIRMEDVAVAVRSGAPASLTVGQLADHDVPILSPEDPLEVVLTQSLAGRRQLPVADAAGRLVGLLDLDSVRARSGLVI
ncbi:CBS domain-containing protein [Roseiconus nitratireducens]|uniref:Zinc metalloprotease n=1 Tax=Roseiconus nitratireducens TaxID=2605748 RepID=A0A5M6D1U3_9BACT|nr:site-2 protease family protein [Roseiconus nitratireducens]KAA5540262.1 CBS domain-containing protein [Roseiconus nitratireducens]